ncbi:hypothetical protein HDU84_000820 [Entophlyctis sp. JEL0112]|nr:hypothetical protein HDU84_000820 [Entophlyctis sp. JEL0112]
MPHSFGLRARTRHLFARDFRTKGQIKLSTYLVNYKVGDIVDIKANGAVQKGMPHKYYHGKTGIVYNVTKSAVGVIVNKRVGGRYIEKRVNIRVEHIKHSKCRDDFLKRVRANDRAKAEAKITGVPAVVKRLPAQPRPAHFVSAKKNAPVTVAPIPYEALPCDIGFTAVAVTCFSSLARFEWARACCQRTVSEPKQPAPRAHGPSSPSSSPHVNIVHIPPYPVLLSPRVSSWVVNSSVLLQPPKLRSRAGSIQNTPYSRPAPASDRPAPSGTPGGGTPRRLSRSTRRVVESSTAASSVSTFDHPNNGDLASSSLVSNTPIQSVSEETDERAGPATPAAQVLPSTFQVNRESQTQKPSLFSSLLKTIIRTPFSLLGSAIAGDDSQSFEPGEGSNQNSGEESGIDVGKKTTSAFETQTYFGNSSSQADEISFDPVGSKSVSADASPVKFNAFLQSPHQERAPADIGVPMEKVGDLAFSFSSAGNEGNSSSSEQPETKSPTKYDDIVSFLSKKGNKPLSLEDAAKLHEFISKSIDDSEVVEVSKDSKTSNLSETSNTPEVSVAKPNSQVLEQTEPLHSSFAQKPLAPVAPLFTFGSSSGNASSLFGQPKPLFAPVFSFRAKAPAAAAVPSTTSSIINRSSRAGRELAYTGASFGSPITSRRRPVVIPGSFGAFKSRDAEESTPKRLRSGDNEDKLTTESEVKGKRRRGNGFGLIDDDEVEVEHTELANGNSASMGMDSASKLILGALDDSKPPVSSLADFPVITNELYDKPVPPPAVLANPIPKASPASQRIAKIREVKAAISATVKPKSALLSDRIGELKPSIGGTPSRPSEKNTGSFKQTSLDANSSLRFPVVAQTPAASAVKPPVIEEKTPGPQEVVPEPELPPVANHTQRTDYLDQTPVAKDASTSKSNRSFGFGFSHGKEKPAEPPATSVPLLQKTPAAPTVAVIEKPNVRTVEVPVVKAAQGVASVRSQMRIEDLPTFSFDPVPRSVVWNSVNASSFLEVPVEDRDFTWTNDISGDGNGAPSESERESVPAAAVNDKSGPFIFGNIVFGKTSDAASSSRPALAAVEDGATTGEGRWVCGGCTSANDQQQVKCARCGNARKESGLVTQQQQEIPAAAQPFPFFGSLSK